MGGAGYGQMIAGAIQGGVQAYQETDMAEQEAKYNRGIALYNAQIARNQATEAMHGERHQQQLRERDSKVASLDSIIHEALGKEKESDERRAGRRFNAAFRASSGMSGFAVDSGSSLDVQVENARIAEYSAQIASYGDRMAAFKSRDDAKMLMHEAEVHAQRADYLRDTGIQAAGQLYDISAAYYKKWAKFYDNTMVSQVVGGVLTGAFGNYKGPVKPPLNTTQDAQNAEKASERGGDYNYDRNEGKRGYVGEQYNQGRNESMSDRVRSGGNYSDSSEGSIGSLGEGM